MRLVNFSEKVKKVMKGKYKIIEEVKLDESYLIVGWNKDTGRLSQGVIEFINKMKGGVKICELEPEGFFSFSGVSVEDDVARFPFSDMYYLKKDNIILFFSDQPDYKPYEFLNLLLDVSEKYYNVKELYTLNGLISLSPHTISRKIYTVFNNKEFLEKFKEYNIELLTWEGTPAISSYLLWLAKERDIPGMSIWTGVPFYLATVEDYESIKATLEFFNKRFSLNIELDLIDEEIAMQNEKIKWLRETDEEIDSYINQIEDGQELDEDKQLKLIKDIFNILKR